MTSGQRIQQNEFNKNVKPAHAALLTGNCVGVSHNSAQMGSGALREVWGSQEGSTQHLPRLESPSAPCGVPSEEAVPQPGWQW